jgi:hypothetical protein
VKRKDYDDDDGNNKNNNNNNLSVAAVKTNRPRGLVAHTDQSDERFR